MKPQWERRHADRPLTPPCPECHTDAAVTVATRTEYVIYFRCATCCFVWSVQKPNFAHLDAQSV
jgi:hypothetical protein